MTRLGWAASNGIREQIDLATFANFRETEANNGSNLLPIAVLSADMAVDQKRNELTPVRQRPAVFRALGKSEPPAQIWIKGQPFRRQRVFKHDSWAATGLYASLDRQIVCKFNRTQSLFGLPLRWLGNRLARREARFFALLSGVPGIPQAFPRVMVDGQVACHAFAHEFIPGQPLSLVHNADSTYFSKLEALIDAVHARQMAYVDLNKPENVLVGDDGNPYLFDFQISVRLPAWPVARSVLKLLQQSDRYHLMKHKTWRLNRAVFEEAMEAHRPWWIRWHRKVGVPLRNARRRLLVLLRIRRGYGAADTEVAPELGLCTAEHLNAARHDRHAA